MGCCGCDNKTSANTAGIFALIQCIVGFSLAVYNLKIFNGECYSVLYDSKGYICTVLYDYTTSIRALLIVVLIIYILWAISSVLLLVGNSQNRAGYIRQWVVLSTIIIICDLIFPIIIAVMTYTTILNAINHDTNYLGNFRQPVRSTYDGVSLSWNYIGLLLTFSRGGFITWISDIALTVYASRRATEILHPPATYVFTQALPTNAFVNPNMQPPQFIQGYVPPQQGYIQQQQGLPYYQPGQFQPQQFQPNQPPSDNKDPPPKYMG